MNKVLYSSKETAWGTPQWLFDKLDAEFHFDLDAAASSDNAKVKDYYDKNLDGLKQDWSNGHHCVWLNPPYGRDIYRWVEKAYNESHVGGVKVVALLPSRTDTRWFHDFIYGKAEIRFVKGRLKFTDKSGKEQNNATFPSMIVIWEGRT